MRISRINGRKNNRYIFTLIAALSTSVAALALFGGCSVTPIFATIETEIPLATPTVLGKISELFWANPSASARELYLTNGKLKRKTATSNSWADVPLPASTTALRVTSIATDTLDGNGSLYALFVNESDWTVFNSIQRFDGSAWTPVTGIPEGTSIGKIGSGNGRIYAFVKTGSSGSKLIYSVSTVTGTVYDAASLATLQPSGNVDLPASSGDYVVSSDTVFHWDGSGLTTLTGTGNTGTYISVTTDVSGNPYVLSTSGVYVSNDAGTTWTSHGYSVSSPVQSISVLDQTSATATDFILVSGLTGYCEITGTVGGTWAASSQVPGISATSSISTSANAQYTSSLALYCVDRIFGVTNHTPSGDTYVIYASVRNDTFDGLWGYYPETRANWNRES